MSIYFFLSYASDNQDEEEVKKFFTDLEAELRRRIGEKRPNVEIGFIDHEELKAGVHWERELLAALQASSTLVCLYSPAYFKSLWCGREWKVFHRRQELSLEKRKLEGADNSSPPRAIKPIMWIASEAPPAVSGIQSFTFDTPEDIYHQRGLFYLIQGREKYEDEYNDFIFQLARDIHRETVIQNSSPLQVLPLPENPLLGQIESAFGEDAPPIQVLDPISKRPEPSSSPPRIPPIVKKVASIFACALAVALAWIYFSRSGPHIESSVKLDTDATTFISPNSKWKIWAPTSDSDWPRGNVDEICHVEGRRINGERVGLFKTVNSIGDYNFFGDFIFHISVSLVNDKGVAWVVRAKDFDNYYLFELTTAKSNNGKKQIRFFRCLKGTLELIEPVEVVDEIDELCKQFDLYTLAKGSDIRVFFKPFKPVDNPIMKVKYPVCLGVFQDSSFPTGGVGFYPRQGMDFQLHQMRAMPQGTGEFEETERVFPHV